MESTKYMETTKKQGRPKIRLNWALLVYESNALRLTFDVSMDLCKINPFNTSFNASLETYKISLFNVYFNAFILDLVIGPFKTYNGFLLVFVS